MPKQSPKYKTAEQGLHVVRLVEIRPPQECSAQELVNELVRRALREQNLEELRKGAAAGWRQPEGGE